MRRTLNTEDVQFICTREPQPKVDRETGAPRVDRETGEAQSLVQVAALDSTGGEVLAITVAGRPQVTVGELVSVEGLVAIPWAMGDRSGIAYRASAIRASGPSTAPRGPDTPKRAS